LEGGCRAGPGPDLFGFQVACNPETTGKKHALSQKHSVMSSGAIDWAWQQDVRPATLKLLLVAMGELANHESHQCYPSAAMIEQMCGMNLKTIPAAIQKLVDLGYLTDTGERVGRTGQVRVFLFTFLGERNPKTGVFRKTPDSGAKDTRFYRKDTRNRVTEPSIGTKKEEDSPPLPSEVATPHGTETLFERMKSTLAKYEEPLHDRVARLWKAMSERYPSVASIRGMDDSRKRAIAARASDAVKFGSNNQADGWDEIFSAISRSAFLRGEAAPGRGRQTAFRLTLDFVLKPTNFRKIIEGGYDDRHDARTSDADTGRHYGPTEQAGRAALPGFLESFR
jgi:hypothetical protein